MSSIVIKYNGTTLSPTPLINRSNQMIDLVTGRWGTIEEIELKGFLTGISATGDYSLITSIFTGNFGNLIVTDEINTLYNWNNMVVEDINFDSSKWPINGFTPYSVKLKAFNIPSGIIDASNEYSFTQNEDGTVTVTHKISAKGVNTNNNALTNAINFVNMFTGKNPYTNCIPTFIPNGNGVLLSISENLDRMKQSYSVNEIYKYVTGSSGSFIEVASLTVDESPNKEYITLDYDLKYKTSPLINNSLNQVTSLLTDGYLIQKINNDYGITGNIYKDTFSITQNTGAAEIDVKISYISGMANDINGYFDWIVSDEEDLITTKKTWKVEGNFICKGPISFRIQKVTDFKNSILSSQSYEDYLKSILQNSILYQNFARNNFLTINTFTISENIQLGTFKLTASYMDYENPFNGLLSPKVELQFEPERWTYELIPASNIEGHYILQDLQMKTRPKVTFSASASNSGDSDGVSNILEQIFQNVSGLYFINNFLTKDVLTTGYRDISLERQVTTDSIPNSSNLTKYKVFGSLASDFSRNPGYLFGY